MRNSFCKMLIISGAENAKFYASIDDRHKATPRTKKFTCYDKLSKTPFICVYINIQYSYTISTYMVACYVNVLSKCSTNRNIHTCKHAVYFMYQPF